MKRIVALALISLTGMPVCTPGVSHAETPPLKQKMQQLYRSLTDLLNDVSSDERYNDPKNSERIQGEIQDLQKFAHGLGKKGAAPAKPDPTLPVFAGFLETETRDAYQLFKNGDRHYARVLLRDIPSYCIACHTRNATGAEFGQLPFEPSASLKPAERANFFAASRQFDRALELYEQQLQAATAASVTSFEVEYTLRTALGIAVRFKHDPAVAKRVIGIALGNPSFPHYLQHNLLSWKESVEAWEGEKRRKPNTEQGMRDEALRLIAQGRKRQEYPMDRGADIYYLRASSVLFDLLQAAPAGRFAPVAYLLQGICYEVLSPHRLESLHSLFYESCVRSAPHTETARACYRRYEQSMFFAYSGSSGTHLPQEVQDKLLELWSIASKTKE